MPNYNGKSSPVALPYYMAAIITLATCVLIISLMFGIGWRHGILVGIGTGALLWGIVFSILEVRRNAGLVRTERTPEELEAFRNPARRIIVEPPTDEATPHHENHPGIGGQDQGQITSRWPSSTPLVDRLFSSEHSTRKRSG